MPTADYKDPAERRCATCELWRRMGADVGEWDEGRCLDGLGGVNVEIHGDATADITTDAEFGCPGWSGPA